MELTLIVQGKLRPGEKAVVAVKAGLVQDWVKSPRILALVERQSQYALFIFSHLNTPITCSNDVTLSNAIPLDSEFRCDPDRPEARTDSPGDSDVFICVLSHKKKWLLELPHGLKTDQLLSELSKALTAYSRRRGAVPDFGWVKDYQSIATDGDSQSLASDSVSMNDVQLQNSGDGFDGAAKNVSDTFDVDGTVPRRAIAMGEAPIAARESVVKYQMAQREGAFTDIHNFRVFVGTWNVNGQSPPASGLLEWLACDPEPPDIYAIGFQELDLSKEAFLFNDTPKEEEWTRTVLTSLHPKARYRKKKQIRLVGMLLFVFVQERHDAYISAVGAEVVGTGIMGKMGNKGGVSIRLDIHSTSVCFINAHLAAHVEECERRNQDFHDICSRLAFTNFMPPKTIKHHDQIFWLGDLNYRLVGVDCADAKALIDKGLWADLWPNDQLKQQQQDNKSFMGFYEAPLDFKPTYKFANGSDEWDEEKGRAPAWTDRVLWKGDHVEIVKYRAHPTLRSSDHRPVSALFNCGIKVIDAVRYRKIYEEVMKQLDKLENEFLPQVTVDKMEVLFDTVRFLEPQSRSLTIANTGQVPVQFEFIKKLNDTSYCKPWLSINPYADFLKPGEKRDIELRVRVDPSTVARLNSGSEQLYDILVLHLDGGKDLFITVMGDYQRTCFGLSLHTLVQLKVPIADVPSGKLVEMENDKESELAACNAGVPKEIWLMVDRLYNDGLDEEELFFAKQGLHVEIRAIRDALDTGLPDTLPGQVSSVAGALLLFLESLPEPVVPFKYHQQCLEASSNYLNCQRVASSFPDHHRNLFFYICAFLKEALLHANKNGLDPKTLATLFGGIMLREPFHAQQSSLGSMVPARTEQALKARERQKANFVYHFLVNDMEEKGGSQ